MKGKGGTRKTSTTTLKNQSKCQPLAKELPEQILLDIFFRLPTKSILKCRCVCKTWLHLLSDPYFSNLYFSKSPIDVFFVLRGTYGYPKILSLAKLNDSLNITSNCAFEFHVDSESFHVGRESMMDLKAPNHIEKNKIKVCSSLDGLICLFETRTGSYYVYNPLAGENVVVPRIGLDVFKSVGIRLAGFKSVGCWLGLSAKSNEYKLLQFLSSGTYVAVFVHTLGGNSWRKVALTPNNLDLKSSYAPFLSGALHWVSYPQLVCTWEFNGRAFIFSFGFEEEKFRQVPAPLDNLWVGENDHVDYACYSLGLLGGRLSLCSAFRNKGVLDIWVMNEYGIKESWTKLFVLTHLVNARNLQPLRLMGNGEILVLCDNRTLVLYNPNDSRGKGWRYIKFYGNSKQRYFITPHVPSFVKVLK